MSTNKTQNYNLHSWVPTDDFLRAEINENFTKLDAAIKAEATALQTAMNEGFTAAGAALLTRLDAVCGAYTGDDTSNRAFVLGKKPFAVIIERPNGGRALNNTYGGLFFPGGSSAVKFNDQGFVISERLNMNVEGVSMCYMAFFKAGS